MGKNLFTEAYGKLNDGQKKAVDAIEGPVMVIAGPGTGKTQVLTLRIANILDKTDTPPHGILCLTFTNSGVRAMRNRLREYIGIPGTQVRISTFHSFALELIKDHFSLLGFSGEPELLDDTRAIVLFDEILQSRSWEHLRPRGNSARYFYDVKSLVSLLKRERITPQDFQNRIEKEIDIIGNDPSNISSRGATKGQLKKEAQTRIEGLERTKEVVEFYRLYELSKKERNTMDYDDVLSYLVELVHLSEDVRAKLREQYLYILVDEHQDSSGIQNEFLSRVWATQETQNVFVVGDDRQLIYGFGGASLHHFTSFKDVFPKAQILTLLDNYRSTQVILDTAEALLRSTLAEGKLQGHRDGDSRVKLAECDYPRDEIILAGLDIKEKIKNGVDPNECALLVPKNKHVKSAITILEDMDIPVASGFALHVFELPETESLLRVLNIIANPIQPALLARTLLDPLSGISPLSAHAFLSEEDTRSLSISTIASAEEDTIRAWGETLSRFVSELSSVDIYDVIQKVGDILLLQPSSDHDVLTRRIEIIRTLLHIVLSEKEQYPRLELSDFLDIVFRLREYGTDVPLAVFGSDQGVKVMTLHSSKGLEFESVWIAHVDEKSLMSGKRLGFAIPESIESLIDRKDEEAVRRELYVAITRAKHYCTLSYARQGYTGIDQVVSPVIAELLDGSLDKVSSGDTERSILSSDQKLYVAQGEVKRDAVTSEELAKCVSLEYEKRSVSVTLLNNFFECPWKWYFRSFLQLPEPKNESLIFGSIVHNVIEHILKQKEIPSPEDMSAYINAYLDRERVFDDAKRLRYQKDAERTLRMWCDKRLPEILAYSFETERALSYRDPRFVHLLITGKIDLVEYVDDYHVRVTDFKTGGGKSKSQIEKADDGERLSGYMRQLAMYSYLLHGASKGNITVAESKLEFVEGTPGEKDDDYITTLSSDMVESLLVDIEEYDEALREGTWIGRDCCAKLYNGQSECEYCKLANIYLKQK